MYLTVPPHLLYYSCIQRNLCLNSITLSPVLDSFYVLEGLKPQTSYEFRFAARNEVGLGNWGAFHREITPGRTFPNEPKIITPAAEYDLSMFNNQYELSWLAPADNGEPIDMYQIKYCQLKRVSGEWEVVENTCRTEDVRTQGRMRHWLRNLYSDTFYQVELKAHNAIGFSKPGLAKFKTARGKCLFVTILSSTMYLFLFFFFYCSLLIHTFFNSVFSERVIRFVLVVSLSCTTSRRYFIISALFSSRNNFSVKLHYIYIYMCTRLLHRLICRSFCF